MAADNQERISQRAYEIWEQEGKPQGDDMRHWLQALAELGGTSQELAASDGPKTATSKNSGAQTSSPSTKASAKKATEDKLDEKASQKSNPAAKKAEPNVGASAGALASGKKSPKSQMKPTEAR